MKRQNLGLKISNRSNIFQINDRKNKSPEEERRGRSVLARGALENLTEAKDLHSPWKRQIPQAKKRKGDQKAFLLLNLQIKNLKVKKS